MREELQAEVEKARPSGVSFTVDFDGTKHRHGPNARKGKSGSNVYLTARKGGKSMRLGFNESTMLGHPAGALAYLEQEMQSMEASFQ